MMKWMVLLGSTLSTSVSQAADVDLKVSLFNKSCAQYESTNASFLVSVADASLASVSEVWLRYGFEARPWNPDVGAGEIRSWQDIGEILMTKVSDGLWSARFNKQLSYYSVARPMPSGIDFVFRIVDNSGNARWERGSDSTFGFYRAGLNTDNIPCGSDFPPAEVLKVISVARY